MTYICAIRRLEPQPTMCVREPVSASGIAQVIGEFVGLVMQDVTERGGRITGPPYTRYHEVDGGTVDLEAGLPVETTLPARGRVRPSELPGGEVAVTTHIGSYEGLVVAGSALANWTSAQGREGSGPNWEVYITAPGSNPDPARWETQIFKPLRPTRF